MDAKIRLMTVVLGVAATSAAAVKHDQKSDVTLNVSSYILYAQFFTTCGCAIVMFLKDREDSQKKKMIWVLTWIVLALVPYSARAILHTSEETTKSDANIGFVGVLAVYGFWMCVMTIGSVAEYFDERISVQKSEFFIIYMVINILAIPSAYTVYSRSRSEINIASNARQDSTSEHYDNLKIKASRDLEGLERRKHQLIAELKNIRELKNKFMEEDFKTQHTHRRPSSQRSETPSALTLSLTSLWTPFGNPSLLFIVIVIIMMIMLILMVMKCSGWSSANVSSHSASSTEFRLSNAFGEMTYRSRWVETTTSLVPRNITRIRAIRN